VRSASAHRGSERDPAAQRTATGRDRAATHRPPAAVARPGSPSSAQSSGGPTRRPLRRGRRTKAAARTPAMVRIWSLTLTRVRSWPNPTTATATPAPARQVPGSGSRWVVRMSHRALRGARVSRRIRSVSNAEAPLHIEGHPWHRRSAEDGAPHTVGVGWGCAAVTPGGAAAVGGGTGGASRLVRRHSSIVWTIQNARNSSSRAASM
jgi:hypothetical protein